MGLLLLLQMVDCCAFLSISYSSGSGKKHPRYQTGIICPEFRRAPLLPAKNPHPFPVSRTRACDNAAALFALAQSPALCPGRRRPAMDAAGDVLPASAGRAATPLCATAQHRDGRRGEVRPGTTERVRDPDLPGDINENGRLRARPPLASFRHVPRPCSQSASCRTPPSLCVRLRKPTSSSPVAASARRSMT